MNMNHNKLASVFFMLWFMLVLWRRAFLLVLGQELAFQPQLFIEDLSGKNLWPPDEKLLLDSELCSWLWIHRSSLYFHEVNPIIFWNQEKLMKKKTEEEQHQLHYLGFSIHQEVASDSFCFLINSSWLLVFILFLFLHALGLNLYWWKGIHFS